MTQGIWYITYLLAAASAHVDWPAGEGLSRSPPTGICTTLARVARTVCPAATRLHACMHTPCRGELIHPSYTTLPQCLAYLAGTDPSGTTPEAPQPSMGACHTYPTCSAAALTVSLLMSLLGAASALSCFAGIEHSIAGSGSSAPRQITLWTPFGMPAHRGIVGERSTSPGQNIWHRSTTTAV